MTPVFFSAPSAWRSWLRTHHASEDEVWVGFYKKATGRPSMTWSESVDEAICFGWIDGLRRSIDEESYKIRFTPRRPGSNWSAVNIEKAEELIRAGRMQPSGLEKYKERDVEKGRTFSYERATARLSKAYEDRIRARPAAWDWFRAQAPGYRRIVAHWIMSAKREVTRERRLATLIESSAAGLPIPPLRRSDEK